MDWSVAEPLSRIDPDVAPALVGLPTDPVEICRVAQGLVMLPVLAAGYGIPDERQEERSIRGASDIVRRLLELDSRPVGDERDPARRVVGTCRHFALLSCAFLRHRHVGARARCGFATYFVADRYVDHWVTEYWHTDDERWVRIDSEILGFDFLPTPDDLSPGEFLSGGEAWELWRGGGVDPMHFGVDGFPEAWGIGEVRGNAVRDLAALNKVEMLPWDEWGRMHASYDGETGPEYDALMDRIAAVCALGDGSALRNLYHSADLAVPAQLVG